MTILYTKYNATKVLPSKSSHGKPILDNKKQNGFFMLN